MQKVYEIWVTGTENSEPVCIDELSEGAQEGTLDRQTLLDEVAHQATSWLREGVYSVEICVRWD